MFDCRLPGTEDRYEPFTTVGEFHRHLRHGIEANPNHWPEVSELIALQEDGRWPVCFTHGDLSSLNILARGDQIVGIVDWETAGWLLSYWEYTTAMNVNPRNAFWRDEIDYFLEPMPTELRLEKLRLRYFGDF